MVLTTKLLGNPNGFIASVAAAILVLDLCNREKKQSKIRKKKKKGKTLKTRT